ncbi:amidohydrolase family protein [archaeon]|nr:amidohydrolase family protein [archaeon]
MIVDSHCHVGRSISGLAVSDPERVLEEQRDAAVDYTIVFPLDSKDPYFKTLNKLVYSLAKNPSIIGFMRFNPRINISEFVKEHADNYDGIKIHPRNSDTSVNEFRDVVIAAEEHDLPVIFHSNKEVMTAYEPVFKEFNKVKLIAAHGTAYKPYKEFYKKYKNLYYDTSIKMSPMSMKRLAEIDPNRILFGSDYPYSTPSIERMRVKLCPPEYLSTHEKNLILGLNAAKLFKLGKT